MALVAWVGVFSTLHADAQRRARPLPQSPEAGKSICTVDDDCPEPLADGEQVQACLTSVCRRGACVNTVKSGFRLGFKMPPDPTRCYEEEAVCSVSGTAVASPDASTRTARADGSLCSSTAAQQNVCQRSICRSMRCVVENDDGVRCNDPDRTPTLCESSLCKDGQCIAQADPSKEGKRDCQPATTRDCRTTSYSCTKTGACEGTTKLSDGSQCAPDLTLGSPDVLPVAFRRLFETAATPPQYSCDAATCQLRFCGDGIVTGDETCDGSARAAGIGSDGVCNQNTCRVEYSGSLKFVPVRMTYGEVLGDGQLNAAAYDQTGTQFRTGLITYASGSVSPYERGTRPQAGRHPVTATWAPSADLAAKYTTMSTQAELIVDPKKIRCMIGTYRKKVNEPDPPFTFSCEGLVTGDTLSSLGGSVGVKPGSTTSKVGTADLVFATNPSSPNYEITLAPGTITVEAVGDPGDFDCSKATFASAPNSSTQMKSEDFFICGGGAGTVCEDMRGRAETRKAQLLTQGYQAAVVGGPIRCNPWNGNPCAAAEPSRWSLSEARVCYFSKCGDGKLSPDEACDGDTLRADAKPGSTCDKQTCTVIPPKAEVTCGDLSLTATAVLNRQWGLYDVSIAVTNSKKQDFAGYPNVAFIVIDEPQGFTSQFGANTGNTWYNPADWSCANLKTDPNTGLLITPEGRLSTSSYGCYKFDPAGAQTLLNSGSALRDDNNPEFLIANSSVTGASYEGKTGPAIRLATVPAIASNGSWTATSNAKIFNPMRTVDLSKGFSARLVCEALDTCGDGIKGPSEQCDGSVPEGMAAGSTCNASCQIERCGDGIKSEREACDGQAIPSTAPPGSKCNASCQLEYCGDRIRNGTEACDGSVPPGLVASARCNKDCAIEWCGDGIVNGNETCDGRVPPLSPPGSTCGKQCTVEYCGDGIANGSEDCDGTSRAPGIPVTATCDQKTCKTTGCAWLAVWATWTESTQTKSTSLMDYLATRRDKIGWTSVPSCFKDYSTQLGCRMRSQTGYDIASFCRSSNPTSFADFLKVPFDERLSTEVDRELGVNAGLNGASILSNSPYVYYMDANCQYIPESDAQSMKVCGAGLMSWSPIALLLDPGADISQGMTVAKFSVDARQPDAFTLWKASDKAPLLVYDPDKTGAVTSARQLFGNYAFGGKTAQPADFKGQGLRDPWANGYEALGVLDKDRDGSVSGGELEGLALWLDANRDGISDKGEVVPVSQLSIKELFYKDPQKKGEKEIELTRGFTRLEGGKEVVGRSIDWFSETFSSQQEAAQALAATTMGNRKAEVSERVQAFIDSLPESMRVHPLKFSPHRSQDNARDLSGYWMWHTKDKDGINHPGFMALEQTGDRIVGYNATEMQLVKNGINARSAVGILPVEGEVSKGANGAQIVTLRVLDPSGQMSTVNTITVSEAGAVMDGKSEQQFAGVLDGAPASAFIRYEWRGVKVMEKGKK